MRCVRVAGRGRSEARVAVSANEDAQRGCTTPCGARARPTRRRGGRADRKPAAFARTAVGVEGAPRPATHPAGVRENPIVTTVAPFVYKRRASGNRSSSGGSLSFVVSGSTYSRNRPPTG